MNTGKTLFARAVAGEGELRPSLEAAVREVIDSGTFILGPKVEALEAAIARLIELVGGNIERDFLRLPLIAVVGAVLYAEPLDPFVFAGAAVIFCGIWLNVRAEIGPIRNTKTSKSGDVAS